MYDNLANYFLRQSFIWKSLPLRPDTEAMHHTSSSVFDLTMCMFGTFDFYNYINLSWKCDITIIIIIDNVHSMIIIKDNVLYTLSSVFWSISYVPLIPSTFFKQKFNTWWWLVYLENFGHNKYQVFWVWYCSFYTTSVILGCVV
mgnify:CR=1 FL=1